MCGALLLTIAMFSSPMPRTPTGPRSTSSPGTKWTLGSLNGPSRREKQGDPGPGLDDRRPGSGVMMALRGFESLGQGARWSSGSLERVPLTS